MQNYPLKNDGISTEPSSEYNDITAELKNTVEDSGITLNGSDSTQIGKAIANYSVSADFFVDSGTPNAYILSKIGDIQALTSYRNGSRVRFIPTNDNTGASTITVNGIGVKKILKSNPNVALESGDLLTGSIITLEYDPSADSAAGAFILTNGGATVDSEYIYNSIGGLKTSTGTDTDHDIDVSPGSCMDSTNTVLIVSPTSFTKQIDVNWAEGTNDGGFPSGLSLTSNTTYHFFAIAKTNGDVDFGWDSDLSATNLLSDATDYTYFRRIWSLITDSSSNIINYLQQGDYCTYKTPIPNINTTLLDETKILSVITPFGIKTEIVMNIGFGVNSASIAVLLLYLSDPDTVNDVSGNPVCYAFYDGDPNNINSQIFVMTNTSSQIRARVNGSGSISGNFSTTDMGYRDYRGK